MGVARAFGKEGYALSLVARNPAKLVDNAQTLKADGYDVQTFAADAGEEASLVQAFTSMSMPLMPPWHVSLKAVAKSLWGRTRFLQGNGSPNASTHRARCSQ